MCRKFQFANMNVSKVIYCLMKIEKSLLDFKSLMIFENFKLINLNNSAFLTIER